ncbi:hypothetical protein [Dyadobacter luteus]|nr:hypothetical protein [Dyadobacter luteus]
MRLNIKKINCARHLPWAFAGPAQKKSDGAKPPGCKSGGTFTAGGVRADG